MILLYIDYNIMYDKIIEEYNTKNVETFRDFYK